MGVSKRPPERESWGIFDFRFSIFDWGAASGCGGGGTRYGGGRHFVAVDSDHLFQHREQFGEAELLEDGGELGEEFGVDAGGFPVERRDGDVELQFDEFTRVVEDADVGAERLADFAGEFVGVGDEVVDGAVGLDPLGGGFWADAGDAGDVVDGVAGESEDVAGLLRGVPFFLEELGGVDFLVCLDVVHHALIVDELVEILVLGAHEDSAVGAGFVVAHLADERGDGVVGFEALGLVDRHAKGVDDLQDAVDLRRHVFGHRFALGFVGGVERFAAGGAGIHRQHHVRGLAHLEEFEEHADEAEGGVGRFARGGFEAHDGVVGTVDLGVAVDELQSFGHRYRCPWLVVRGS